MSAHDREGIRISARSLLISFGMQDIRRQRARDDALAREIPLALIRESDRLRLRELPYHGIDELAEKIRLHGQTSPVFVRGVPEGFELIAGYRRCAAIKRLGMTIVIARVFDLDDAEAYDLAISENQDRGDLSDLERAKICLRLQDEGRTIEQIAVALGWNGKRSVYRHLRLAKEAPEILRSAFQRKTIQMKTAEVFMDHALALSEEQQRAVLEAIAQHEMSASELKRHIDRLKRKGSAQARAHEPIRALKNGGFVLSSTRFDPEDLPSFDRALELLQTTLKRAKRLKQSIEQSKGEETTT